MLKLFISLFVCFISCLVWAQPDDKSAFKDLKKLQGNWFRIENGEKILADWKLKDKSLLYFREYKIQKTDTLILKKAYIHYSKFVRFHHLSSLHFNLQSLDSDVVYPHRLEKITDNLYFFTNTVDEIIFELGNKNFILKYSSKEKPTVESFFYEKIKY